MGQYTKATVLLGALGLAFPRPVAAQEATRADETFQAGHSLLKDGKFADACPKFEESQRADPASGTLLALAYCQELSGLLASSWSSYVAAAELAAREGQAERQSAAVARAKALLERVSTLTIVAPAELSSLPGLRLLRDGIELERASFNAKVPLNGGMHWIEVTAPGRKRWAGAVTLLPEADHKTLNLPILEAETQSIEAFAPVSTPAPAARRPLQQPPIAPSEPDRLKRVSLILGIGSGVGLGLGGTFGLLALSRNNASNRDGHCVGSVCDPTGTEHRNSALSAAHVANWSFVAAGALAVGSVTVYLASGSETRVETSLVSGSPRVSLTGAF